MTSSTFDEAIADAKKLRELAEQNAKNAIIDAVTPRIRELIESHLTGDAQVEDLSGDILEDVAAEIMESPEETIELTPETVKKLSEAMGSSETYLSEIEAESLKLQESVLLNSEDLDPDEIKERVAHIYSRLQECSDTADSEVLDRINNRMRTLKENLELEVEEKEMSGNSLRDALNEFYLAEEDEDLELEPAGEELDVEAPAEDDMEFDLEDEELEGEEEVDVDVSAVRSAVEDLAQALGAELDFAGEEGEADLEGEEDLEGDLAGEPEGELDFGDEEAGEPEEMEESFVIDDALLAEMLEGGLEEDLYEVDADEGIEDDLQEGDDDLEESGTEGSRSENAAGARRYWDAKNESVGNDDDVILEIDERMLRQELMRMRKLNESRTQNSTGEQNGSAAESAKLQAQLNEAYKAVKKLRRQLNEANLFNAKLLYANKLLNNKELSERQRVVVVESLDKARSLREVKLLYKSLSDSVEKKNINESRRRPSLGSSSRPSASGSPKQESLNESARWQQLAGIK